MMQGVVFLGNAGNKGITISEEKRRHMLKILDELKDRMSELKQLREELGADDLETRKTITSEQARAMLEEIKVPSLELIKDSSRKSKVKN
ncbi:MAG: hypothetical protein V1494_04110 [Candidatus Diapherotrites archaeon]